MEDDPTFDTDNNSAYKYEDYSFRAKLGDRFGIIRSLGRGATCKVKLGIDKETGLQVAIKILNDDIGEEIQKEVGALFILQGLPNIVQVIAADQGDYVKPIPGHPE